MRTTNRQLASQVRTTTRRSARVRVGNAMSPARRYAVLDALVARVNRDLVTTARYLAEVLHADAEFVRRFAGSFGKIAKAVYLAEFGTEPTRSGIARVGTKLFAAFAYRTAEIAVLDKAAASYPRTAALLAA